MDMAPRNVRPENRPLALYESGLFGMMHVADDWNQEAARFVRHRVNAYADLAEALGRCTTPPAAMMCCARFFADTVEAYGREMLVAQGFARRAADEALLSAEAARMPVKAPTFE